MTKPELGMKRLCVQCGAKFYDLHHSPITCPKCGSIFESAPVTSRFGPEPAGARVSEGALETPERNEVPFFSLEGAEEETPGKPNAELEGEEDTVETDDASLNGAGLIDEIEEDDAEVTDVIEDDESEE
jgi:uncharacterized protein (TIGR02300 family)